ncbi:Na/Pi cotransporter family protein [Belliella kenyensis]|uniref:Na/Pi cotransporter family protein n=1 Tax=Belliella kenyensis TaxID=1472724 RepID=A0ABV8EMJ9_9BACT|nr:Na/Pi symporter [Belliella kenyensis]MCH7400616.1 Na/Pi symporter [Belliella kenyensis]MDN3602097.1 Na/Pi symporter [Belliella kenyensis]
MENDAFDFWKFLAGIGVFLWGMNLLEGAIKELGGKSFRNLLQKSTNTALKGVLIGALITAVLQSSSLVTLMVLAFLGAGIINLKNAIGVVLGANLGTTITAWIVATLGFKLSVAAFALPFLGVGCILYLFLTNRPILKNTGAFAIGFGLLFLGLDFMKTAIEAVAEQIDLSIFASYGLWVFMIIGIVVTALIQSSSAMIVIVLSAMSSGVIDLTAGAVVIIGANIGTTVTVGLGSLKGTPDKKRLALAHFLFNAVTGIIVFIFIERLIFYTMKFFHISDPLMELVFINTVINLIGLILFFPFISQLEKWLNSKFVKGVSDNVAQYIHKVSPSIPEAAIAALEKDVLLAIHLSGNFIQQVWGSSDNVEKEGPIWKRIVREPKNIMVDYQNIKVLEDELTAYHIIIQKEELDIDLANKATSLMLALRLAVYAAKDFKDIIHNVEEMKDVDDLYIKELYRSLTNFTHDEILRMNEQIDEKLNIESNAWISLHDNTYQLMIDDLYRNAKDGKLALPFSTLTNVIKQTISGLDNYGDALLHRKYLETNVIDLPLSELHK